MQVLGSIALYQEAESSGQGRDQLNTIAKAKVRAEWHGGHLLQKIERQQGKRSDLTSSQPAKKSDGFLAAIAEAGLYTDTAYRWQMMFNVSEPELNA
jgi:hypothetical protein